VAIIRFARGTLSLPGGDNDFRDRTQQVDRLDTGPDRTGGDVKFRNGLLALLNPHRRICGYRRSRALSAAVLPAMTHLLT
jgi:hypothetical protein